MSQIPVNLQPAWESGSGGLGKNARATYIYILNAGAVDDEQLCDALIANLIPVYDESGRIFESFQHERLAPGQFKYFVDYCSVQEHRPTGSSSFQFELGGGTTHIIASLQTVGYGATTGPNTCAAAPNNNGLINFDPTTGHAAGVDIDSPSCDFACAFFLPTAAMGAAFQNFFPCVPSINSDNVTMNVAGITFNFPAGSLKFRGASGTHRTGTGDFALNLRFSAKPNSLVKTIAGFGPGNGIPVNGWDYLEVRDQETTDAATGVTTSQVIGVYVHRVYPYNPIGPIIPTPGVMLIPDEAPT
jgi:hypothetical protein